MHDTVDQQRSHARHHEDGLDDDHATQKPAKLIPGGLATLHPATRRAGSAWSIATLIAIFPANLHMALNAEDYEDHVPGGEPTLWARLPVQLLFIAWAYAAGEWGER